MKPASAQNEPGRHLRFKVMGTNGHVIVIGGPPALLDQARDRLEELERRWSRFLTDSELSALNARPAVPVVVSPETYGLIESAVDAWRLTGGSFDPTIEPTMTAAGYDRSFELAVVGSRSPAIDIPAPGPALIQLDPTVGSVQLPPGVRLDLGGIAKGAAADLVAAELLAAGAEGCCINLGGDLRAMGRPPRPQGWQVVLDCPGATAHTDTGNTADIGSGNTAEIGSGNTADVGSGNTADVGSGNTADVGSGNTADVGSGNTAETGRITIGLTEGAVCTSTIAKRRWETAAGPQHHLRDPATGRSLSTGLRSVTVISASAMQAEVLTKAVFVAGPVDGPMLAANYGATGLVVDDDGRIEPLPGLAPFISAARRLEAV